MASLSRCIWFVAIASAVAVTCQVDPVIAEERPPCTEDAMLVFDASGSMSSNGWGYSSGNAPTLSRIDLVRYALGNILPSVTRFRAWNS